MQRTWLSAHLFVAASLAACALPMDAEPGTDPELATQQQALSAQPPPLLEPMPLLGAPLAPPILEWDELLTASQELENYYQHLMEGCALGSEMDPSRSPDPSAFLTHPIEPFCRQLIGPSGEWRGALTMGSLIEAPVAVRATGRFRALGNAPSLVWTGGGAVWGVDLSGQAKRYDPTQDQWVSVQPGVRSLAVGNARDVWALTPSDDILRLDGSKFRAVPGRLSQIAVGSDGAAWGINSASQVYRWNSSSGALVQVAGSLRQIAVGNAGAVWGINESGFVYRFKDETWQQVPGKLAQIAVGTDGDVWGVSSLDRIVHFNHGTGSFEAVSGNLSQISVADAANVWGVNRAGEVYRFEAGSFVKAPDLIEQVRVVAAPAGVAYSMGQTPQQSCRYVWRSTQSPSAPPDFDLLATTTRTFQWKQGVMPMPSIMNDCRTQAELVAPARFNAELVTWIMIPADGPCPACAGGVLSGQDRVVSVSLSPYLALHEAVRVKMRSGTNTWEQAAYPRGNQLIEIELAGSVNTALPVTVMEVHPR